MTKIIYKLFLIITFTIFFLHLFRSCKKDLTPVINDQPEIKLIVEDVGVTEAWLRLNIQNPGSMNQITITRNDSVIGVLNASTFQPINSSTELDTLIYDFGLLPNHNYTYTAKLTTDSRTLTTAESRLTTMDTTSHEFTWDTLSFGIGTANELRDVAIINENNIWAVGDKGTIVHFNGSTWQKLESGTDTRLRDVWGNPDSDVVWACGWDHSKPTVLLKIENGSVIKVYEDDDFLSTVRTDSLSGRLTGGIQLSHSRHYISSNLGLYLSHLNNPKQFRRHSFTTSYFPGHPFGIDGNGENDVFLAGERFIIAHFNGYTWRYFDSLYQPGRRLNAVAQKGNTVVAVGRTFDFFNKAVILTGNR